MLKFQAQIPGVGLLKFLKERLPYSRDDLRWSIEHHRCKVNGLVERFCSYKLRAGDFIEINPQKKPVFKLERARVLFDEHGIVAYNKPIGISSEHLAKLLNCLLVHRLDRDTSGIILFAKNEKTQKQLETLFRKRCIIKTYLAIVNGKPQKQAGVIENFIGKIAEKEGEGLWAITAKEKGKFAKTTWEFLKYTNGISLIACQPVTGRTHQIRIHLSSIGHPICGDVKYGKRKEHSGALRPLLHAFSIEFTIDSIPVSLKTPLPEDFKTFLSVMS